MVYYVRTFYLFTTESWLFIEIVKKAGHRISKNAQYHKQINTPDHRNGVHYRSDHRSTSTIHRLLTRGPISASLSIIAMSLAYIPGHTDYYQIVILILAKMYSNSMIAAINCRMRVVSNSGHPTLPPSWNESARPPHLGRTKSLDTLALRRDVSSVSATAAEDTVWILLAICHIYYTKVPRSHGHSIQILCTASNI